MNNEDKILQILSTMQADFSVMKSDIAEVKTTQKKQGELLEEVDQRSARTQILLETDYHDKLQLLYDGHAAIMEKLNDMDTRDRVEVLEDDIIALKTAVKSISKRLSALEKAQ